MREIKFRGIREKTGEWVYGYLVEREEPFLHDIVVPVGNSSSCTWAIKRGSEGQYTGLKDKNNVEIYNGDIVKGWRNEIYTVAFVEKRGGYYPFAQGDGCGCCDYEVEYDSTECEVLGNRYENPELLEGNQ